MKKLPKKYYGFTLVELIIVITILAILSTIAFVSFQNYTSQTRDTNRISSIKNIEKGLQISVISSGKLPLPDSKIDILSSGSLIGYQGSAGINTLNIIKSSKSVDPVDNNYYTYSTNIDLTKYELLTFFENTNQFSIINKTYALNQIKYPKTYGDNIGILTDQYDNPIQNITNTGVDLLLTNNKYNLYLSSDIKITGTGNILKTFQGESLFSGLIGYWGFDDNTGNNFSSTYTKKLVSSIINTDNSITYSQGKVGKGVSFNGTTTGLFFPIGSNYTDYNSGTTVSFYVKTNSSNYNGIGDASISFGNFWVHIYGNSTNPIAIRYIPSKLNITNLLTIKESNPFYSFIRKDSIGFNDLNITNTLIDSNFHQHTITFTDKIIKYYIDGIKIFEGNIDKDLLDQHFIFGNSIDNLKVNQYTLVNGNIITGISSSWVNKYINGSYYNPSTLYMGQSFYGTFDEVRVYNRSFNEDEIKKIYELTK